MISAAEAGQSFLTKVFPAKGGRKQQFPHEKEKRGGQTVLQSLEGTKGDNPEGVSGILCLLTGRGVDRSQGRMREWKKGGD